MKPVETKPLNEAVKEHYNSKALSSVQLESLLAMQQTPNEKETEDWTPFIQRIVASIKSASYPVLQQYRFAAGMSFSIVLVALIMLTSVFSQGTSVQEVMEEIAYNHNQRMSVEISASSINDINQFLGSLSFTLIESKKLNTNTWTLLGGRYCSINGKLAAQLKVKNRTDNKVYTFYQAVLPSELDLTVQSPTTHIDGVKVNIWQENGLLLGLAGG